DLGILNIGRKATKSSQRLARGIFCFGGQLHGFAVMLKLATAKPPFFFSEIANPIFAIECTPNARHGIISSFFGHSRPPQVRSTGRRRGRPSGDRLFGSYPIRAESGLAPALAENPKNAVVRGSPIRRGLFPQNRDNSLIADQQHLV